MNTIIKNSVIALASILSVLLVVLFATGRGDVAQAASFTTINSQMGIGSSGADVTNLQTFLASDHNIYPAGLITGYYGSLTSAAVAQFQLAYSLPMVGNVGPLTMAKVDSVILAAQGIDIYAPVIRGVTVTQSASSAIFTWNTSEFTTGKVYYSASPFVMAEASGNFAEPIISGGASVLASSALSQQVNVQGLQPNTLYYYVVESTDSTGNVSVTPEASFMTNL